MDLEQVKDEYFFTACDYYVAGRFAFWARSMSICGTQFHHALEMFLKGHLLLAYTVDEVSALGHDLPKIWELFKRTVGDPRLDAFDRMIGNVHAFEANPVPGGDLRAWRAIPS